MLGVCEERVLILGSRVRVCGWRVGGRAELL